MQERASTPDSQSGGGSEPRGFLHGWFVRVLFALLILYPASTGPVVLLARNNIIPQGVISVIYLPLIALGNAFPPIERFFDWYVSKVWGA